MRLIDADAIQYCEYDLDNYHWFRAVDEDEIAEMPTIDAVHVIRCKNCKHWSIREGNDPTLNYFCNRDGMWCKPIRKPNDFCSYGEPRGERKE